MAVPKAAIVHLITQLSFCFFVEVLMLPGIQWGGLFVVRDGRCQ